MLIAETLGVEDFRQWVKTYATDVDEETLQQASQAVYSAKDIQSIPLELRDKYFELVGESYVFRQDLRRSVIFGPHNLIQDAPISPIDLLVCRNTLMYFHREAQGQILARFQLVSILC
jgi:two-component system CheB/CheR fusion protein